MNALEYQNRQAARAESDLWPPAWVGGGRDEQLERLADVVGGRLLADPHGGPGRVTVVAGAWSLELDFAHASPGVGGASTRARARYASGDGFDFTLHPTDGWSWLARRLGGREAIRLGHAWFDGTFLLRTSCARWARAVLCDAAVLDLLGQQWRARLAVRRTWTSVGPPAAVPVNVLAVAVPDRVADPRRAPLLIALAVAVLDRLAAVGSARPV